MNIHAHIQTQSSLAREYAADGAFHRAASILRRLAKDVEAHAMKSDEDSWKVRGHIQIDAGTEPVLQDRGEMARAALKGRVARD